MTGTNLLFYMISRLEMLQDVCAAVKASGPDELLAKAQALVSENRAKDRKIAALTEELTHLKSSDVFASAQKVGDLDVYIARLDGTAPDALRTMGDEIKAKGDNAVGVIGSVNGDKANIVAVCGKQAIACGVKAGDLVREVAKLAGGGGGGRPDSAMAGAKDISKLDEALSEVLVIVQSMMQ